MLIQIQIKVGGSGSANGLKLLDTESHMGGEGRLTSIQIQETQGINTIRGNTGTTYEEKKTNIEDVQALTPIKYRKHTANGFFFLTDKSDMGWGSSMVSLDFSQCHLATFTFIYQTPNRYHAISQSKYIQGNFLLKQE